LDDPAYVSTLTVTGEAPTAKSIARMRLIQAKAEQKAQVRQESVTRKAFQSDINAWWESYPETRDLPKSDKETIVNVIMARYDALEKSKNGADPTFKEVAELKAQMVEMGYTNPGGWFSEGYGTRAEAIAAGKEGKFVTRQQYEMGEGPTPGTGSNSGKIKFVRKDKQVRWLTEEEAKVIRGNPLYPDWTEVPNATQ
jgi:hypothetical protein